MSTEQQRRWMAQATAETDGSTARILERFEALVIGHLGAYQIPQLDVAQAKMCSDQALHDTFGLLGVPLDETALDVFTKAAHRREYELGHIMRTNLLHPLIQRELWTRRVCGYGTGAARG